MTFSLHKIFGVSVVLSLVLFASSCTEKDKGQLGKVSDFDSSVSIAWSDMYLQLDQVAGGYRPGASARTAGLYNYAAYEALIPGMSGQKSLAGLYPELKLPTPPSSDLEMNWAIVANSTYSYMLERLFWRVATTNPNIWGNIKQLYNSELNTLSSGVSSEVVERSKIWGEQVGRAVYEWSRTDAYGHDTPIIDPNYIAPIFSGSWEPTAPDFTKAFFPFWGKVRTFATINSSLVSPAPVPYSTDPNSEYYKQGIEVYNAVNDIKTGKPGSEDQKWIGWFWSDDITQLTFSPPARLIAVGNQMVATERFNLEETIVFYGKLGTTINDVAVSVWKNKYKYNTERPITFIRRVVSAQYPDAATWSPILDNIPANVKGVTPPFPAYPSGHSGFGGGMDVIYSAFFGSNGNYTMTDRCHSTRTEFPGMPRTYTSFAQMGEENAYSRIPLGVHFRMDCSEGLRLGREVGKNVLALPWDK
jgi:PAP2 superfamily